MFFSKKQIWCLIVLLHYMIPCILIGAMLILPLTNGWLLIEVTLLAGLFLTGLACAGFWKFTTGIMKYVWGGIFFGDLGIKLFMNHFQFDFSYFPIFLGGVMGAILLIVLAKVINIFSACSHQQEELELAFPFKEGDYLVCDGGDGKKSSLMNYHFKASIHGNNSTNASMSYAVDIVKLGKGQRCCKFVYKAQNEDYEIFEEPIYAPISGTVVSMENGIEDNKAFPRKLSYTIGNHVTIKKGDYYVVLGHFRKGSIKVKVGENVQEGQLLGNVGNSGLTPRLHLHMQVSKAEDGAYWGAQGIPIAFSGRVPYKNRKFHV